MTPSSPLISHSRATRRVVLLLALVLAFLISMTWGAAAARAHGGPIVAQVAQDGEGGVYVAFTYEKDGHPVEVLLDATMEARSADGEVVGPITLTSASQGVGIWETPPGTLTEGDWQVDVTVTDPVDFETTAGVTIAIVDVAEDAAGEAAADAATSPVTGELATESSAGLVPVAFIGGAVVLALLVGALVVWRRIRVAGPR